MTAPGWQQSSGGQQSSGWQQSGWQQAPAGWQQPGWQPHPPVPKQKGSAAWWCCLVVFALIPILSSLAAGAIMWGVGASQRSQGPLARHNGTRAMNWGVTYLASTVVWIGLLMGIGFSLPEGHPWLDQTWPLFGLMLIWLVHTAIFLVGGVWAAVVAGQGRPVRLNGIPFFRG